MMPYTEDDLRGALRLLEQRTPAVTEHEPLARQFARRRYAGRRLAPIVAATIVVLLGAGGAALTGALRHSGSATPSASRPSVIQAPGDPAGDGAVAFATAMMVGLPLPAPAPSQQRLLDKQTLTHQDYLDAVQAAVDCVADAGLPNTSMSVTPSVYQPMLSDVSLNMGDGYASDRAIGRCVAEYSAHVAERWSKQVEKGNLSPSEEATQKAQFIACLKLAGVTLPATISDSALEHLITTPHWADSYSGALDVQVDSCLQAYPSLINTLHNQ